MTCCEGMVQIILYLAAGNNGNSNRTIDTTGISGPSTSTFRPPPGFMDNENPQSTEYGPLEMHECRQALDRIRAQAGSWHELAQLLPRLAASGYDAQVVEFETGLERVVQNAWFVAQSVSSSKPCTQLPKCIGDAIHLSMSGSPRQIWGYWD